MAENFKRQLQLISQYLDPHILIFLLQKLQGSEQLVEDIQKQMQEKSSKLIDQEQNIKKECENLLTILNNTQEMTKLRQEKAFTLKRLQDDKGITMNDCKNVYKYAKILYEQQKYKESEKYLFSLKEILSSESQSEFILTVYWGLIANEIINKKDQKVIENTTMKKIKELIDKLFNDMIINTQENILQKLYLINWILVQSFCNKSEGLFSLLFYEKGYTYQQYLQILQVKMPYLIRYIISSVLLANLNNQQDRNIEQFYQIYLPIIKDQSFKYQDCFTNFVISLYDKYDFDSALKCAKEIKQYAQQDIFLSDYQEQIYQQSILLVYYVRAKLYTQVNLNELSNLLDLPYDSVLEIMVKNIENEGNKTEHDENKKILYLREQIFDHKKKIMDKTMEILKRTQELNKNYQNQMNQQQ